MKRVRSVRSTNLSGEGSVRKLATDKTREFALQHKTWPERRVVQWKTPPCSIDLLGFPSRQISGCPSAWHPYPTSP